MPVLLSENYSKTYYAPAVSMSSFLCYAVAIVTILLPFFAAFATDKFFDKISVAHEQPAVKYNNQFILYCLTTDRKVKSYSSILKLNDYFSDLISAPIIKVFSSPSSLQSTATTTAKPTQLS